MNETIREMERYAEANNVPIIERDSIEFIQKYIKLNEVKSILEIGTAIGYSAILMALTSPDIEITTIERDEKRYREAVKNINKTGMDGQIDVVFNDALDINLAGHKYDLIFIDAAKGQYTRFFEKYKYFLKDKGAIITDNLKFHGYVGKSDRIESKNLKSLVEKIENYIDFLKDNEEFDTKFYDIGDGLSVSTWKNEK